MSKAALKSTILAARLVLRAPRLSDEDDLVRLANNENIFATTATLPFPYTKEHAIAFVDNAAQSATVKAYIVAGPDDRVVGVMSLRLPEHGLPELGYWLGEPHWGQGYASEAAMALLASLGDLPGFSRIEARALESNQASVRVLQKAGFTLRERTAGQLERHAGKPIVIMDWSAP